MPKFLVCHLLWLSPSPPSRSHLPCLSLSLFSLCLAGTVRLWKLTRKMECRQLRRQQKCVDLFQYIPYTYLLLILISFDGSFNKKTKMPGLEAALAPDLDIVVLDGDAVDARAQAGEEGESRAQVHRQ
jgi:hypothetical protein